MFLRELEDFLLELRDNYGFLIPVDRLKQSLSCFGDITDMEEVFYRMQALICENEEQIDVFRSLFAQRFLKIQPRKSSAPSQTKPSLKPSPFLTETEKAGLEGRLLELKTNIEQTEREMQELAESRQKLDSCAKELSEKASALDSETQALKDEKERLHAEGILNSDNPKLREQYKTIHKQLENTSVSKSLAKKIQSAMLSGDFKKELDAAIKDVMAAASKARTAQDLKTFKACLDLVASIKKFQTMAGRSSVNVNQEAIKGITQKISENKKALEKVNSEIDNNNLKSQDANRQSQKLYSTIYQLCKEEYKRG